MLSEAPRIRRQSGGLDRAAEFMKEQRNRVGGFPKVRNDGRIFQGNILMGFEEKNNLRHIYFFSSAKFCDKSNHLELIIGWFLIWKANLLFFVYPHITDMAFQTQIKKTVFFYIIKLIMS